MLATQIITSKRYIPCGPDAAESITSHVDTEFWKSYLPIVWPPDLLFSSTAGVDVSYADWFPG